MYEEQSFLLEDRTVLLPLQLVDHLCGAEDVGRTIEDREASCLRMVRHAYAYILNSDSLAFREAIMPHAP